MNLIETIKEKRMLKLINLVENQTKEIEALKQLLERIENNEITDLKRRLKRAEQSIEIGLSNSNEHY